ncbi:MAG: tetratricopeptide repeat protein [Candidatus Eremiobacterota bacterium]
MSFSDESQKNKKSPVIHDFQEMAGEELDIKLREILGEDFSIDYVKKAAEYIQKGNIAGALEEYDRAIVEFPDNPLIYQCAGNLYADTGNMEEARLNYEKALAIEENLPFTRNNLGLIFAKTGQPEKAIREFKTAIDLSPKEDQFWNNAGNAWAQSGNFKEAIVCIKKAVELNPSGINYKFNLALCLEKDNQFNEAIKLYEEILSGEEGNKKSQERLLNLYKKDKNHEQALALLEKSLSLNRTAWLLQEKGSILKEMKNFEDSYRALEEALSLDGSAISNFEILGYSCLKEDINKPAISELVYKKLVEKEPERKEFYNSLGISLRKQGKLDEAVDIYKKGIEINPAWSEIRQSLGNVYADQEKYDDALREFKKASELTPNDPWIYGKTGHIYQLTGEYKKAIEYFEKALELNPTLAEAAISTGVAYYYLDDMEKAESNFYHATLLDPLNVKAHGCWVETVMQQKNLKKAIERYEKELKNFPDQSILHYGAGLCSFYRYQLDNASKELDTAIRLNPYLPEAFALRGDISYELKKLDEAISFYEKAKSLDPSEPDYDYTIGYIKRIKKEDPSPYFERICTISPGTLTGKCAMSFILMDKGEIDRARDILMEAIKLNKKASEPYFILGLIHEISKEPEQALNYYREAYKLNPMEFDAKRCTDRLVKERKV